MNRILSRMTCLVTALLGSALIAAALPAAAAVYTVPGDFATLNEGRRVAGADDTVVLLEGGPERPLRIGPGTFRLLQEGGRTAGFVAAAPPPDLVCVDGILSGRVTDEIGAGVAGAQVWIHNEATGVYTVPLTGPTGTYTACLPAGNYGVLFFKDGYVDTIYDGRGWGCGDTVAVRAGQTTGGIDGVLLAGGIVAGTVTSDGSTPLGGVNVVAYGIDVPFSKSGTTLADGSYAVQGLRTGTYWVRFSSGTNGTEYYNDHAMESESDTVSVTLGGTVTGIDAVLPPAGSVSGTVDDGSSGISGVLVSAYLPDGSRVGGNVTSGTGSYQIQGLRSGSYRIEFNGKNAGFIEQWHPTAVTVTAPADTAGVDATLSPGGGISGAVTDGGAGLANIGVNVFDSQGNNVAYTDTLLSGDYTVTGLPSGEYRVYFWAEHEGYSNEWYAGQRRLAGARKVTVTAPADTANVNVQLTPFVGGTLSGRVNYRGGSCDEVRVRISPTDVIDETWWITQDYVGPSGTWHSTDLAPGRYLAVADASRTGYQSRWYGGTPSPGFAKTATVRAGQNTGGVNFKVPARGPLPEARIALGDFDDVTFMGPGERQPLLLSLDCNGAAGRPVDWWLLAFTPLPPPRNVYHLEPGRGWVEGLAVSLQGPCGDLDGFKVMDLPFVPFNDQVDIFFGVDGGMNGALDPPLLFYDGVRAHMYR